jgi:cell division septum initiation protein DivIVA
MSAPGDGWRPMSPDGVRRAPLRESGLGRRGYRPEDVDRLRADVAEELDRWARAYAEAQNEIQRLRDYYRHHGVEVGTGAAGSRSTSQHGAPSSEAVEMMARAQAYADQLVAEAQAQARHVQSDARTQGESIVSQARREADQAGQAYRARAGESYSPDREETERLTAWARSILATMQAVQHQLGATAEAFSLELNKLGPGPATPAYPAAPHSTPPATYTSGAGAHESPFG